jgi:hypothetical protein
MGKNKVIYRTRNTLRIFFLLSNKRYAMLFYIFFVVVVVVRMNMSCDEITIIFVIAICRSFMTVFFIFWLAKKTN